MPTLYTAIIGRYDYLKPLLMPQGGNWRFICFTDQERDSDTFHLITEDSPWEIIKIDQEYGPVKTARYYKIMFHKHIEDELSMWLDGTFFINTNVSRWMGRMTHDFTTVAHPFDNCAYTDAFSCMGGGKGNMWELIKQIHEYREEGLPENNGLISSGLLMRRRTPEVIDTCELWWEQVKKYSERDQIAFGYVNWKKPEGHRSIEWNYTVQKEFIHCPHRHKKNAEQRARLIAGKQ